MSEVKMAILFCSVLAMETVGMALVHRERILAERGLMRKIMCVFPHGGNHRIYYIGMLLIGLVLSYVLVYVHGGQNMFIQNIRLAALYGILVPTALIDFRTHTIPNVLVLLAAEVWVLTVLAEWICVPSCVFSDVKYSLVAAGSICAVCVLCKLVVKNGIGMGDIKLFMAMGLLQGPTGMSGAVFLSMVVAFFGAAGMLLFKKKTRKDTISFAPFILIGTTLSMFLNGV